jgi:hypothetical protein
MSNSLNPSGLLERGDVGFSTENLSWAHWLGVLIATVTGAIHVYLYLEQGFLPFLFAGIVFLAAAIAVLLNLYRRLLYAVGIPFTAGQIVLWYAQGMPDMAIAQFDKPLQVVLVVLLAYLFVNEDELTGSETNATERDGGRHATERDEGRDATDGSKSREA